MISAILYPILLIACMGLVLGVCLGIAAKVFKVEQDPKIPLVRECLPGANCGGCGFAGCDAFAEAVANGVASVNGCPVGGEKVAKDVASVMGVAASSSEKMTAYVNCNGNCDKATNKFEYQGSNDCAFEATISGGRKACTYGCLGGGNCVKACNFDAIKIVNGIAVVDQDNCVACGACVKACPKSLIDMVPFAKKVRVTCNSLDNAAVVMKACEVGCIGCGKCARICPVEAINITSSNTTPAGKLAKIDYSKCIQCGKCIGECPKSTIVKLS